MVKTQLAESSDFESIFLNDAPMLDLRAPVEFTKGAFPGAVNLPLMTDEERKKVGICYKNYGQDAAIKLGNKIVSGEVRDARMQQWKHFIENNPEGYLYCFRGGLRSRTVQRWLAEAGQEFPLISGGYKAMRSFLIENLNQLPESLKFTIIGGRTGTRKTDLILAHPNAVDLEGLANHRGSSFGRRVGGQPTVINFENNLSIELLKLRKNYSTILLEDEGVTIGCCSVPEVLRNRMQTSPIYLVEASVDERVENILRDYVLTLSDEYLLAEPEQGWSLYKEAMLSSLDRIKKRLGGERYKRLAQLMHRAFDARGAVDYDDLHRDWIRVLLIEYYDPMYDFQIAKKQQRIQHQGDWQSLSDKLHSEADKMLL